MQWQRYRYRDVDLNLNSVLLTRTAGGAIVARVDVDSPRCLGELPSTVSSSRSACAPERMLPTSAAVPRQGAAEAAVVWTIGVMAYAAWLVSTGGGGSSLTFCYS
jgi:hypothetical protein